MRISKIKRFYYLLQQRGVLKAILWHLRHKLEETQPRLIPEVVFPLIVPNGVKETVLESPAADLDGNVRPDELRIICKIVNHFSPANIFEIGTFDGRTTVNMAANAPAQAQIWTLDLPPGEIDQTALRIKTGDAAFILKDQSGREFLRPENEKERKKITQLLGDSAKFDYSPYQNKMDLVFVDGAHSYEYVLSDTKVALSLLRDGKGIILWHDYGWREVVRALNELYQGHPQLASLRNIAGTSLVYFNNTNS